jgi:ssDNA-binding replication factor A large subunit
VEERKINRVVKSQPRSNRNYFVSGVVTELLTATTVTNKTGVSFLMRSGKIKDDTGEIEFKIWNENVNKIKVGDKLKINSPWVGWFEGALFLSIGKTSTFEVLP